MPSSVIRNAKAQQGQGLVEYALLLSLVAVAVMASLKVIGPTINDQFCQVASALNSSSPETCQAGIEGDDNNEVVITHTNYNSGNHRVNLHATYNGSADPDVTLTASPGGQMEIRGNHYQLNFRLDECPCTITVTASTGESDNAVVGS